MRKSPEMLRAVVGWSLSLVLTVIFLWAGIAKLRDLPFFAENVESYRLLPAAWIIPFATSLPWVEILGVIALWFPSWRLTGSLLLTLLCTIFCIAITIALFRGIDVSCGCFGKSFQENLTGGIGFLVRDLLLLVIGIANCRYEIRRNFPMTVQPEPL